jgi:hypothetical protein
MPREWQEVQAALLFLHFANLHYVRKNGLEKRTSCYVGSSIQESGPFRPYGHSSVDAKECLECGRYSDRDLECMLDTGGDWKRAISICNDDEYIMRPQLKNL